LEQTLQKFLGLLPENLRKIATRHSKPLDSATADYLCSDLDDYQKKIFAGSKDNPAIDVALIGRMVATFKKLLLTFRTMPEEQQNVVSIAIRYFIDTDDAQNDFSETFGFDDDLAVLNAALLAIGREDLLVVR